ncbi:hypothetical protein [Ignicoccus hospitalis]|uniref:Uncharacterized protein n=1 Tax=Ignicoccus hospitalis (strain KIN4/I / DSM 18386 / JCM 14125) TaxID=453591 RepID=A8AB91_IGNH4|nr:hypothetical protein [Ignicoccus hospitalis]ABU82193.1 hypothetical protein Igni_1014 [Ignicoccus hospitalis KIN4/I]HIH91151.1 hypothetical protein [Desulfurococcaceae archaeon]
MIVEEQCSQLFKAMSLKGERFCKPFAVRDGKYGVGGLLAVTKSGELFEVCFIFEVVRFYEGAQAGLFYTDQALCGLGGREVLERAAGLAYEIFKEVTKRESEKVKEGLLAAFSLSTSS